MTLTRQYRAPEAHQQPGEAMDPLGRETERRPVAWQAGVLSLSQNTAETAGRRRASARRRNNPI